MLLDHDGREGNRYLRIVDRLPLDAQRFSFSPGPLAGCIPVPFSFGGDDLSPTLGLYPLIAFLFRRRGAMACELTKGEGTDEPDVAGLHAGPPHP